MLNQRGLVNIPCSVAAKGTSRLLYPWLIISFKKRGHSNDDNLPNSYHHETGISQGSLFSF